MNKRVPGPAVLMLVRSQYSNDSRVVKEAESLTRLGCRVKVIALREPGRPVREVLGGVEVVRPRSRLFRSLASSAGIGGKLPIGRARSRPAAKLAKQWLYAFASALDGSVFALQALVELLRSGRPAVVHAHDLNVLPAAWLLSLLAGAKLVYDSHEIHSFTVSMQKRPRLWRAACRRVERYCIRHSALVITVSESCARAIARVHHVAKPLALYNVPRLTDGRAASRRVREGVSAAPGEPVAVFCGWFYPHRGIEQSIEAIALLPGVKLALMGFGEQTYQEKLRRLAAERGVGDRLFFVPAVAPSEVSAAIRGCDVSLVLTQETGLNNLLSAPNKLFESLHAGVPIIGGAFPEFRAIVSKYRCGLLVDQTSPQAIAEAIRTIIEDSELKARMSAGALAAAERFNWENEESKLQHYCALAGN